MAKQLDRDPAEFSADTALLEAGFESLDVIEMIFSIEEEFDISIDYNANDGEAERMTTVGDIVRMVDAELAKKSPTQ